MSTCVICSPSFLQQRGKMFLSFFFSLRAVWVLESPRRQTLQRFSTSLWTTRRKFHQSNILCCCCANIGVSGRVSRHPQASSDLEIPRGYENNSRSLLQWPKQRKWKRKDFKQKDISCTTTTKKMGVSKWYGSWLTGKSLLTSIPLENYFGTDH